MTVFYKHDVLILDEPVAGPEALKPMIDGIKALARQQHRLTGKLPSKVRFWNADYKQFNISLKQAVGGW